MSHNSNTLNSSVSSSSSLNSSQYETPFNSPNKTSFNSPISQSVSFASTNLNFSFDESFYSDINQYAENFNEILSQMSHRVSPTDSTSTLIPNNNIATQIHVNQSLKLKQGKLLKTLEHINSEMIKLESLEGQIMTLCLQFKLIRENLSQQSLNSINLIKELINENNIPFCDAQTQTNSQEKLSISQNQFIINRRDSTTAPKKCFKNDISDCSNAIHLNSIQNTECQVYQEKTLESKSELTEELKLKFRKLPALVKGYLVRRLLRTEKVLTLKRTIRDTSIILLNFKSNLFRNGKLVVNHQDILFHQRLCIQMEKSCKEFYSIFLNTTIPKQMEIIAQHRNYLQNIAYQKEKRASSVMSKSSSRCQRPLTLMKKYTQKSNKIMAQ